MQGQCQVEIYLVNYCRAYVQIELPVTLRAILKNLAYNIHHKSLIFLNCFEILLVSFWFVLQSLMFLELNQKWYLVGSFGLRTSNIDGDSASCQLVSVHA